LSFRRRHLTAVQHCVNAAALYQHREFSLPPDSYFCDPNFIFQRLPSATAKYLHQEAGTRWISMHYFM
jgi:hypothetical protein